MALCIQYGADIEKRNARGETALGYACSWVVVIRIGGHLPKGEYDVQTDGRSSKCRPRPHSMTTSKPAVRLVVDEGKSVGAVSHDLDLTESALRRWVERARANQSGGKTG